jgi:hypothetical protein
MHPGKAGAESESRGDAAAAFLFGCWLTCRLASAFDPLPFPHPTPIFCCHWATPDDNLCWIVKNAQKISRWTLFLLHLTATP